jgi:TupA-like ATPgrasp
VRTLCFAAKSAEAAAMLGSAREWLILQAQRARIQRQFKESLGYEGNFENPRSHQEKMQFRKLYGNHAFYALVTDKYKVREYVAAKVGAQYLIPLLGVFGRLDESIFEDLPEQFIIKANHGCKWHEVVYDKRKLDVRKTIRRFNTLCNRRYGGIAGERHYNFIEPKIVIERLLLEPDGGLPWDYNFFCYNGPQGFDWNFAIASPQGQSAMFETDWRIVRSDLPEPELAVHVRPVHFDVMVSVAKRLSADFDFVRVDLYNVDSRVYFGELTCTPHQGYGAIPDPKRQKLRDEMWHLDAANPLLYKPPRSHRIIPAARPPLGLSTPSAA